MRSPRPWAADYDEIVLGASENDITPTGDSVQIVGSDGDEWAEVDVQHAHASWRSQPRPAKTCGSRLIRKLAREPVGPG